MIVSVFGSEEGCWQYRCIISKGCVSVLIFMLLLFFILGCFARMCLYRKVCRED